MTIIKFTDTMGIQEEYYPKPASRVVPDWYKDMDSYINNSKIPNMDFGTPATIKRCMPVFDAITSGYIITTYTDVWIKQLTIVPEDFEGDENSDVSEYPKEIRYEWSSLQPLDFHPIHQAPTHPQKGKHSLSYPKWMNPWSIKTPPGYSTLFIPPVHRESVFSILPGVVDTDQYTAPVNFPFVLHEADTFQGLIPAGTPIAQVIPFKRDSWSMELGNKEDVSDQAKKLLKIKTKFFDGYKTFYRQTKEYK